MFAIRFKYFYKTRPYQVYIKDITWYTENKPFPEVSYGISITLNAREALLFETKEEAEAELATLSKDDQLVSVVEEVNE